MSDTRVGGNFSLSKGGGSYPACSADVEAAALDLDATPLLLPARPAAEESGGAAAELLLAIMFDAIVEVEGESVMEIIHQSRESLWGRFRLGSST